jgi:hypothetical protein
MSNQITIRCRFATLVVLILVGCVSTERLAPEEARFETTIEAVGAPKDKIYDAGKLWIAETFRSPRAVIDLDDKTAGILIGNGRIRYPCSGIECVTKFNVQMSFKMRMDVRDDRFRLQFFDLTLVAPAANGSGFERPILRSELDNAKDPLLAFGPQIRAAIFLERSSSF